MKKQTSAEENPVRVAIYTRTGAVDGEIQRTSQAARVGRCVRWCEETYGAGGYEASSFADKNSSGNDPWQPDQEGRHRTALAELVSAIRGRKVSTVVVSSPDRLFRSITLYHEFTQEVLVPHGVRLVEAAGGTESMQCPCTVGMPVEKR